MSAEVVALLRAIRDHPDDDLPRLAYADLLDESGDDPNRAAFIRTQVELSRLAPGDPARPALEDQEHELLAVNEPGWLGDLAGEGVTDPHGDPGLVEWEWDRGFLAEVTASPLFMLDHGPDLFAGHPVRRWRVMSSALVMPDDLLAAGRARWTGRLEAVDLAGWYQTVGELERFLTRSDLGRLRELDLTGCTGVNDLPDVLARAPFRESLTVLRFGLIGEQGLYAGDWGVVDPAALARALGPARLTELTAPGVGLTAADLQTLLSAPSCRSVSRLGVSYNPVGPDGWTAFRAADCRLTHLDLSGTPLGGIGLERLLGCAPVAGLRALRLDGCGSAMANVQALAGSRFWRQAEELRVRAGTIPAHALDPLFAAEGPPGLRTLDLGENYLRDGGVAGLCAAPWAGAVEWLGLSNNYLSDDALRTIAAAGRLARLRALHFSYNHPMWHAGDPPGDERITATGLRALADSPALAGLRQLALTGVPLTPGTVDVVLNAPHWQLAGLWMGHHCDLTPEAVRVLAGSPRLGRLTVLDLSQNPRLGGPALLPLAESEYLCPLTELDIRGVNPDPDVRALLRQRLGRRLSE